MRGADRAGSHTVRVTVSALLACLASLCPGSKAAEFIDPPSLSSGTTGVLDLQMIATHAEVKALTFTTPGGRSMHPIGWVYRVCLRAEATSDEDCRPSAKTFSEYGGVRLALRKGDTLKIRLVNRLPKLDPDKVAHAGQPGGANLALNPTNLHTHGLIVPALPSIENGGAWGDYIFMQIWNPANGVPQPDRDHHDHGPMVRDHADYRIVLPGNHPSGAFWFHPHVHGIALNQLSSGLSGIISVGAVGDYAQVDRSKKPFPEDSVRHLVLKDMQVLSAGQIQIHGNSVHVDDGEVLAQEDPAFCDQFAQASDTRLGSCPGADNSGQQGNNYTGGRWFFTVSGQPYPTIPVTEAGGEAWQITNASGSASYRLQLNDDATGSAMRMQLLSVDGVSIDVPAGVGKDTLLSLGGARFRLADCPLPAGARYRSAPVCVDQLTMMPSSRVELWVAYRDASGQVVPPPDRAAATFKSIGLTTGAAGDNWPEVNLAHVEFRRQSTARSEVAALDLRGEALTGHQIAGVFTAKSEPAAGTAVAHGCAPLPPGHRRRIFFGLADTSDPESFGLGYEEVDGDKVVVQVHVKSFDPNDTTICLPLGPDRAAVHETWELVNLATELHNFHIHQTKFRIVQESDPRFSEKLQSDVGAGIMEDNVPLPVATPQIPEVAQNQNGYCTIDQWHNHQCESAPIVVDIPFSQLGTFVFHCHILEHEDGGMMARIQVVASP
jgi:L-ascorbate oxidase